MSIKEKFLRAVHKPNDLAFYKSFTQEIGRYPESACVALAISMKELLENINESPIAKLWTIKVSFTQLLDQCMRPDNPNLLLAVQKRLLERLGILARHGKPSQDPQRGRDLFGFVSLQCDEDIQASIETLRVLLLCLRRWANVYQLGPDGKESGYSLLFSILTKEGVAFNGLEQAQTPRSRPSRDAASRPSKRFFSDIERVVACARSLNQQLDTGASSSVTTPLAAELQVYQSQLFNEVSARMNCPGSEVEMQMLLEATEAASQALERQVYEERKQPAVGRPPAKEDSPRQEERKEKFDELIHKLKAEITDVRNQLFAKRTAAQGNKTPDMIRKEAEDKLQALSAAHEQAMADIAQQDREGDMQLPGLQQKVYELQAIVDNTKARNGELTAELEKAHKQLEMIRFANMALREKAGSVAKAASPVLSPVPHSQDSSFFSPSSPESPSVPRDEFDLRGFATQRNSDCAVAEVGKDPVRNLSQLPVCNVPDFRRLCFRDQGKLYESEVVFVGYQGKITDLEGQFRILVANKSAQQLNALSLFIHEEPVEGVSIETEAVRPMELNPQGKIYRIYRVSVFRPFQIAPLLLLSFTHANFPYELCLRLPLIYPLFLRPAILSHDRVIANWDGLKEWEAVGEFPTLHAEITSMAIVATIVSFNSNFNVLTEKDIVELGKGRVLALGEIKEYMAWALVTIEPGNNAPPRGRVAVRCRNQESRICLLKTLIDFLGAEQ